MQVDSIQPCKDGQLLCSEDQAVRRLEPTPGEAHIFLGSSNSATSPEGLPKPRGVLDNEWLVDCGSNVHIANDKHLFVKLTPEASTIRFGAGTPEKSLGRGTIKLVFCGQDGSAGTRFIENVLLVPTMRINIVSVQKLTQKG